ncbi:MAG: restriction endonuclease subunit S [Sulfurimonas sp.]|nr:restriction endonuclease subunit S [Sulfurimonas sp.]
MKYKKYPSYRDSGIEWLGEIPEHWDLKQGKFIGNILSTPSVSDHSLDEVSPTLYIKVNDLNYIESTSLRTSKHRVSTSSGNVRPISGFICFPKRGAAIATNKACIVNTKSMIDPNLMAWKIFSKYSMEYVLKLLLTRGLSEIADVSTVPQINNKHIEPLKFSVPPLQEQETIANYLDIATVKIDTLIEKQTKLIELLKEKRQAVISTAVTRGLDNTVSMKDSGVEWLGEIPEHWIFSSLKRGLTLLTDFEANGSFADVKTNVTLDSDDKYAWYLRATDLENKRKSNKRTCDEKSYKFLRKTPLYGKELLVAKRGEIGKIYITPTIEGKATLAPNLYLLRMNNKLDSKFAYYWYLSDYGRPQLLLADKSTTIGALYKDDVKDCKIIYPLLEEQLAIVIYLDSKTSKIDKLISKSTKAIDLLKEKRTALISSAVTGKIDVRAVH